MGEVAIEKRESLLDEIRKVEERILNRAYDIFRGNGSIFGKDLDNWLTAERELVWKPAVELKEKDNQFELQVFQRLVIEMELALEQAVCDTPAPLQHCTGLVHHLFKRHGRFSTHGRVMGRTARVLYAPCFVSPGVWTG